MNELKGSKIYVILSVKEGEGFGFLQESSIVSCSLNGHSLQTDPCGVRNSPIYDSELIWETDKKTLRSLRLQNVPIKITVKGVTGKKVGYLLLSLMTASPCPDGKYIVVGHSWHKLLGVSVEAKSSEPKLLLRLIVSDSEKPAKNVEEIKPSSSIYNQFTKTDFASSNNTTSSKQEIELDTNKEITITTHNIEKNVNESEGIGDNANDEYALANVSQPKSSHEESTENVEVLRHNDTRDVSKVNNVTFQSHDNSIVDSSQDEPCRYNSPDEQVDSAPKHSPKGKLSTKTKEDILRKTVYALEKWKEKQQFLYSEKLQQAEKLFMNQIEKEWRQKVIEQERVVKECALLINTLREAIQNLTERSNELSLKENKLRLAKDELEMLYMTKYHELNEAARRMEDDYNHQTKLQHLALSQLESKLQSLEDSNVLYKNKLTIAEEEVEKLKQKSLSQDDIIKIQKEKECLQKQLEIALKSKAFFKEQWTVAVREANILKLKCSTNVTHFPHSDPTTYRFQELLLNEEAILQLDNVVLKRLKDEIISSERSDSYFADKGNGEAKEYPSRLDLGSPSKKSVSYKSDISFI